MSRGRSVIAIPAHDEADRIGDCLAALARDRCPEHELVVVLFANNCRDGTANRARDAGRALDAFRLHVIEADLPAPGPTAGVARRRAMAAAFALCEPTDLLFTTDADGQVEPGWRRASHAAVAAGVDVVCGMAVIDPVEARSVPEPLHADDRRETAYATDLDHIRALLDPDPADPWPRHGEESGASLAIRPDLFRAVGGVPALPLGEDRALVRALARRDARIRHDPTVRVIVSGRIEGRAAGGMADTMRRRMGAQDIHVDDRLEPVSDALRRIRARLFLRVARDRDAGAPPAPAMARFSARLGVPDTLVGRALAEPRFGEAWAMLEAESPVLARRVPITHAELTVHALRARAIVSALARAARPADTWPPAQSAPGAGATPPLP